MSEVVVAYFKCKTADAVSFATTTDADAGPCSTSYGAWLAANGLDRGSMELNTKGLSSPHFRAGRIYRVEIREVTE